MNHAKSYSTSPDSVTAAKATSAAPPLSTLDVPTGASLLANSTETTDQWYKSPRAKKGYGNYVKSGKTWVVDWTAEDRLDAEISADAFEAITEATPLALRAFTAYKCEHLKRGFSTAEGVRSAFKDYFERVLGCQGEFWKYNWHTKTWEGNPVFESGYKTYYESLKNRANRTATTTQALPMLLADLKLIMSYLDTEEAAEYFSLTRRLYFKAFATTAFGLWTRNDEIINLQFKDIKFDLHSSKTGTAYHEFSLTFRKTNNDPTKVQKFQIPRDNEHPEIDCFTHITLWKQDQEGLVKRRLSGSNFVFPAIASTGQLKFGEPTSRTGFEALMDNIVERSNIMENRNGKFTTHCFRRGGAQYRFMWADRKWSLKAVKWWGGWSSSENVGTIMRYLLDELMAYEEGFSDIMMDDRAYDRHETFMGEDDDPRAAVSKSDLVKFKDNLMRKIGSLLASSGTPSNASPTATPMLVVGTQVPATTARQHEQSSRHSTPASSKLGNSTLGPPEITSPSRIPQTKTLDDALDYWQRGAPEKGLTVPLSEWSQRFKSSQYASEAVKLGNIRFVCEEYLIQCGSDNNKFDDMYPGLRKKFTKLMMAVRTARKLRGETKARCSHKHCVQRSLRTGSCLGA
ncbi:hypothetical protein C8J57DRAFT_1509246 [Mycena rebaudengoi]|nr:hypothetical protein C8J57DRAFT_1509246 [Mycena rebaudengoi]